MTGEEKYKLQLQLKNAANELSKLKILASIYNHPLIAIVFEGMEGQIFVGIFEERKRNCEDEEIYFGCSHWVWMK